MFSKKKMEVEKNHALDSCRIYELFYDRTNTYLISGERGMLLFDTGWAGTLPKLFRAFGENEIDIRDIRFLLISHFHPDHMGIAGELMDLGIPVLLMESQRNFIHAPDSVYKKENGLRYFPVEEEKCEITTFVESRAKLGELGIRGEIIPTRGHSEDSISLILDEGMAFVGDLPPLYELPLYGEGEVRESWERILAYEPRRIYYGHAKTAELEKDFDYVKRTDAGKNMQTGVPAVYVETGKKYKLVKKIMKLVDKGAGVEKIAERLSIDRVFVEDVCRMYLTHPGVSVQGILDRIEIKGK